MLATGESRKEVIRPDVNRSIMIDCQGATIASEVGLFLVREIDEPFKISEPKQGYLKDTRSSAHRKHSLAQMLRQRVHRLPLIRRVVTTLLIKNESN